MSKFGNLVVLPKGDASVLARLDGRAINIIRDLPVVARTRCVISDSGIVAFISAKGRRISFMVLNDELKIARQSSILLPPKCHATALAGRNNIFFVGGSLDSEILGCIDASAESLAWQPVPVPPEIEMEGKAIDDILIDEDRLIAVDDIVFPKYLLDYDISIPEKPVFRSMHELENNGTYEHILKAVMSPKHIALLSSTVGMEGTGSHVNVVDRKNYAPVTTLSCFLAHDENPCPEGEAEEFHDIVFAGETLLIAMGEEGVGRVKFGKNGKAGRLKVCYPDGLPPGSVELLCNAGDNTGVICVGVSDEGFQYCLLEA